MGNLAAHLAARFEALRLDGWTCEREARILPQHLADRYGFQPQVDVLLHGPKGRRLAVELEVSRADPVANQVKFLVAYREGAFGPDDALVSMFSPHIARGRRNIAAGFARHLRSDGVPAFQVSLLPHLGPGDIQRLNHQRPELLRDAALPVRAEMDRVLSVIEPAGEREHRIHFAGDVTDVIANVWAWNDQVSGPEGDRWGHRQVQFFVCDPHSGLFAPAKFCAFIPSARPNVPLPPPTMTLSVYASLGEHDPRFDGHRARSHLARRLAFESAPAAGSSLAASLDAWARRHEGTIALRQPVGVLLPPRWYAA